MKRVPAHRHRNGRRTITAILLGLTAVAGCTTGSVVLLQHTLALSRKPFLDTATAIELAASVVGVLVALWMLIAMAAGALTLVTVRRPDSPVHRIAMALAPLFTLRFYGFASGIGLALSTAGLLVTPVTHTQPAASSLESSAGLTADQTAPSAAPSPTQSPPPAADTATSADGTASANTSQDPGHSSTGDTYGGEVSADTTGAAAALQAEAVNAPPPTNDVHGTPPEVAVAELAMPLPTSQTDAETINVQVKEGDSLWSIANDYAGEAASPTEIASLWPTIYQLNAETIGTDPNLIQPGTVLSLPSTP